ncbi:MAG TPA: twin-arginine translocation signal domain-containing protein, partial [Longimicrobium sp.]|nr:twin-arginine translocation signal domain-containing protein [Longimicrobium sp.]
MAHDETGVPEGRWTRRRFLEAMAATGGAAALYPTGEAVADVPPPADGEDDVGQGRSVLVLGAGVGGMATAILLMRRGFSVTLL